MSQATSSALAACPFLHGMDDDQLAMLASVAEEVTIPAGRRLIEDGGNAKRFWLIESGRVVLDLQVPGVGREVLESLGMGDLLGWSWLFPPYQWAFGAVAMTEVRAFEFDAEAVRIRCTADPDFGHELIYRVALVLAKRLRTTRIKLLGCRSEGRDLWPLSR
jgi:CRP/FNR family transcriptional regulator, cyclic AMP receptor protein